MGYALLVLEMTRCSLTKNVYEEYIPEKQNELIKKLAEVEEAIFYLRERVR